ncbi:MAG: M23 family metallopeptidase [Alphaproteobacteria bacterium]|nr:M23 family metallopeptidase [Alphaproteobacteria bacterium]MBU1516220.1 M23 family metallopeptidase [Alphaproteobacteria bacterium]MBU2095757.1 M23 family metallopeptidase [Alphaproteobacteria bacterium]MBU2154042.1 M23 family metallopeptidase [Alphaproteobacteria bacterium]MBU2306844.1 M23 family metallopeptidase [Alphaproteobacteria bacterium]
MAQDRKPILKGRSRLAAEAAIVATAGLSAFAVAHASLLVPPLKTQPTRTQAALASAKAAPAPAADDVLIAFEEPVPGHAVVSPFGLRQLPWEGNGRLHEGVDISADSGVPVIAAADGVVVEAGTKGGYGRYVAVRHAERLTTFYAHLGAIDAKVKPGLVVVAGTPLGRVGSTGTSTGPHLHFEIRDAQHRPLDPSMFLGKAFAEAGDLPLDKAKRYSGRVRMAYVSFIPESKRALMDAKDNPAVLVVRRKTTDAQDLAEAERNLQGQMKETAKREKIDGMKELSIGPDGRPRAQLSL